MKKREIIYKRYNYDGRKEFYFINTANKVNNYYVFSLLYIIKYYTALTLLKCLTIQPKTYNSFNGRAGDINNFTIIKEKSKMNPAYLIKHPFPFRYMPENNTMYYYLNSALETKKFLFTEGTRNDYDLYMAGNCFEEQKHAKFTAEVTNKIWEGVHFLIDRHGYEKLKDSESAVYACMNDMIKNISILIETEQLDLFPEIKPKERIRPAIVDYADTVYRKAGND